MTPFGKEVAKALIDQEMTQGDFAKAMGCSPAFVSGILTGNKKPTQAHWEFLEQRGMTTEQMRAAFVLARGQLSVEGLSLEQVAHLLAVLDKIAPRTVEEPA